MTSVLIALHIILALALIGIILLQKSEGGGLGSTHAPGAFFSVRGKKDFMTRTTAIIATAFIVNCFILAVLASKQHESVKDITKKTPIQHETPTKKP